MKLHLELYTQTYLDSFLFESKYIRELPFFTVDFYLIKRGFFNKQISGICLIIINLLFFKKSTERGTTEIATIFCDLFSIPMWVYISLLALKK